MPDAGAAESDAAPDAKRVKTEAQPAAGAPEPATAATVKQGEVQAHAADGANAGGDDAEEAKPATVQEEAAAAPPAEPVTLGFRTFANGKESFSYFHGLLVTLRPDQDLNEVSHTFCAFYMHLKLSSTHATMHCM